MAYGKRSRRGGNMAISWVQTQATARYSPTRATIRPLATNVTVFPGDQLSPEHRSPVDRLPERSPDLRRDTGTSGPPVIAAAAVRSRLGHQDLLRRPLLPDHRQLSRQSAL